MMTHHTMYSEEMRIDTRAVCDSMLTVMEWRWLKADTLTENESWYSRWRLIPPLAPSLSLSNFQGGNPSWFWVVCVCVFVWSGLFTFLLLCKQTTFKWRGKRLPEETPTQTHTCARTVFLIGVLTGRSPPTFVFWHSFRLCSSQHGAVCVCVCVVELPYHPKGMKSEKESCRKLFFFFLKLFHGRNTLALCFSGKQQIRRPKTKSVRLRLLCESKCVT